MHTLSFLKWAPSFKCSICVINLRLSFLLASNFDVCRCVVYKSLSLSISDFFLYVAPSLLSFFYFSFAGKFYALCFINVIRLAQLHLYIRIVNETKRNEREKCNHSEKSMNKMYKLFCCFVRVHIAILSAKLFAHTNTQSQNMCVYKCNKM